MIFLNYFVDYFLPSLRPTPTAGDLTQEAETYWDRRAPALASGFSVSSLFILSCVFLLLFFNLLIKFLITVIMFLIFNGDFLASECSAFITPRSCFINRIPFFLSLRISVTSFPSFLQSPSLFPSIFSWIFCPCWYLSFILNVFFQFLFTLGSHLKRDRTPLWWRACPVAGTQRHAFHSRVLFQVDCASRCAFDSILLRFPRFLFLCVILGWPSCHIRDFCIFCIFVSFSPVFSSWAAS